MRDVPWEDIFKLGASATASGFCDWLHLSIDVYILHQKYQVKPDSSWFSAACAEAIVPRKYFLRLYVLNKSESKVKFRQANNHCKRVLQDATLAYANNKTKGSITSQKPGSQDFWQIANSVLNKGKSTMPSLFNGSEVLSSASDKAMLFARNLS